MIIIFLLVCMCVFFSCVNRVFRRRPRVCSSSSTSTQIGAAHGEIPLMYDCVAASSSSSSLGLALSSVIAMIIVIVIVRPIDITVLLYRDQDDNDHHPGMDKALP